MARLSNFVFTWHTQTKYFTDYEYNVISELLQKLEYRYILVGAEHCSLTKRPHLQGYVQLTKQYSFSSIKQLLHPPLGFKQVHFEKARGDASDNIDYCCKERNWNPKWVPFLQLGTLKTPGSRTDLVRIKQLIKQGSTISQLIEDPCMNITTYKSLNTLLPLFEPVREWKPTVWWFWGESGSGKTKEAYEYFKSRGNTYIHHGSLLRWQGYDGHENVIIDDFRNHMCDFNDLLGMLDRYPYTVRVLYGSRQLLAKHIIITCPDRPDEACSAYKEFAGLDHWEKSEKMYQLLRRIDVIKQFNRLPKG